MATPSLTPRPPESLDELLGNTIQGIGLVAALSPFKSPSIVALQSTFPTTALPQSLDDLDRTNVRSYDLSITAAGRLDIPMIASVGGGLNRRVVVLEHTNFKELPQDGTKQWWGYAVRFCVTVSKWDSNFKATLPFLAASAEVGSVSAQWTLQIIGLGGPKISEAILPPTELNVEKFVLAKQSLEKIIAAIRDPSTRFTAALIDTIEPEEQRIRALRSAVGQAYALTCIEKKRPLDEAQQRLDVDQAGDSVLIDSVRDVYNSFDLSNGQLRPNDSMRAQAREILDRIRADV